jgi:hypothetical protein
MVAVVGVGALALGIMFLRPELPFGRASLLWAATAAALAPMAAILATPRRFGIALLGGWLAGATALLIYYFFIYADLVPPSIGDDMRLPMAIFGGTLVGLLLLLLPFARAREATG